MAQRPSRPQSRSKKRTESRQTHSRKTLVKKILRQETTKRDEDVSRIDMWNVGSASPTLMGMNIDSDLAKVDGTNSNLMQNSNYLVDIMLNNDLILD